MFLISFKFIQELRQQLESHVLTMEILRSENRASVARHENVCILSSPLFMCNAFSYNYAFACNLSCTFAIMSMK